MSYICGRLGSIYVWGTEINNFFFERSGFPISEAASRAKQCFQSKFRNSTNDFDFQNSIEVSVTLEFSDSAPENDAKSDVESEGSGFGFSADENADAVGTAAGNPESGEDSEGFAFSDVEGGAASAADHPHAAYDPEADPLEAPRAAFDEPFDFPPFQSREVPPTLRQALLGSSHWASMLINFWFAYMGDTQLHFPQSIALESGCTGLSSEAWAILVTPRSYYQII